jgi:hypothetical protein
MYFMKRGRGIRDRKNICPQRSTPSLRIEKIRNKKFNVTILDHVE